MTGPRYWLRRARRDRAVSAGTIAILALGICVNLVVFECVDRLVLNPLPLPDADRIVVVGSEMPGISRPLRFFEPLSGPEMDQVVRASRRIEAILPFDLNSVRMRGTDFPVRLFGAFVWADPVPLLGMEPELGRSFTEEEIGSGAGVALLSRNAFTRDFGADPAVVGSTVELDGEPYALVGVLPEYASIYGVDVWVPSRERLEALPRNRRQFNLMARMADGESLGSVNADLATLAAAIERGWSRESDEYTGWSLQAASFARNSASSYSDEAVLTMLAALLVLALICVNLGNLALVRGVRDRHQAATRLALGGGRVRVALDAAGEAVALALAGGVLGIGLSVGAFGLLTRVLPGGLQPSGAPLGLDAGGVGFALGVTAGAAVLLAVAAVLARIGTRAQDVLSGRGGTGSKAFRRSLRGLVALQLALGLALASGAGAVGVSLARVLMEEPGFAVDELVSMRISLPSDVYSGDGVPGFFETLIERVAALPGASGASMATQIAPNTIFSNEVAVEGSDPAADSRPRLHHTVIGDGYFATMGIALVEGRAPDARDVYGGTPVAVLNEAAARRLFPGERALGRRIKVTGNRFDSGWAEVVGISRDVRNRGQVQEPAPEVFTVHRQAGDRYRQMFLVVGAHGDPAALVPAVRREVLGIDASQPVYSVGTPRAYLRQQVAPRRTAAYLLLVLAGAAVGLAALGLHGVMAYAVATRRRELAIRAAVGADPRRLRSEVFREAGLTVVTGLLLGVLATAWLGWTLRAWVGTSPAEAPPVVVGAALVLVVAAGLAVLRPAHRAAHATDPVQALR